VSLAAVRGRGAKGLVAFAVLTLGAAALGGCGLFSDDEKTPPATEAALVGCEPPGDGSEGAPVELRCTGLYADVASKTISPRARPFAPAVAFWSDAADKHRFIELPDGAKIDSSAMDDWRFPVGTKVWKEFRVGASARLVETRFFQKVREDRWVQASYVWTADQANATKKDGADLDVDGTPYHVPKQSECNDCHRGRKDKLLGFEAVSLAQAGATGLTLGALATEGKLSAPPAQTSVTLAEDATGQSSAALAWLHVNCGTSCHTGTSLGTGYGTGLRLRLGWDEITGKPPAEWAAVKSTVGVDIHSPKWSGETRVVAGDPASSVLLRLLGSREGGEQMPPIATKLVDERGKAAVEAWIRAMPKAPPAEPAPSEPPTDPTPPADPPAEE